MNGFANGYSRIIGFTAYLQEDADVYHRGWLWQAVRSVRFCHVHFQRGVTELTGGENGDRGPDSTFARLMQLLECKSKDDYQELCLAIQSKCFAIDSEPVRNRLLSIY